jgi:hypothetical protein
VGCQVRGRAAEADVRGPRRGRGRGGVEVGWCLGDLIWVLSFPLFINGVCECDEIWEAF